MQSRFDEMAIIYHNATSIRPLRSSGRATMAKSKS